MTAHRRSITLLTVAFGVLAGAFWRPSHGQETDRAIPKPPTDGRLLRAPSTAPAVQQRDQILDRLKKLDGDSRRLVAKRRESARRIKAAGTKAAREVMARAKERFESRRQRGGRSPAGAGQGTLADAGSKADGSEDDHEWAEAEAAARKAAEKAEREAKAATAADDAQVAVELADVSSQGAELAAELLKVEKAIWGEDDRRDLFTLEKPQEEDILTAAESVASLWHKNAVPENKADPSRKTVRLTSGVLASRYSLCDREFEDMKPAKFLTQPSGCYAPAALVGPDLLLTAGHCVDEKKGDYVKENIRVVFGYRMQNEKECSLVVPVADVYEVVDIVARQKVEKGTDWALLRLDRKVAGRTPLRLWRAKIAKGTPVFAIGHPLGLPAKYAPNAKVLLNDDDVYFVADLDTYAGNSGCPVFAAYDGKLHVVGVLVRGLNDLDLVQLPGERCHMPARYRHKQFGEDVIRNSEFQHLIP